MRLKSKDSKNWFREKISRFKPVVFIKKNLIFFIILLILLFSFLIGVWNINRYEIFDSEGFAIDEKVETLVNEYLEKNVTGENFFSIYAKTLEESLERNISYVESAKVFKIVPNKLQLFINIYEPKSVVYDRDNQCKLLSESGIVLGELCSDTEDILLCCIGHTSDGRYYMFKSDEAETSKLPKGKEQLLVMNGISDIVKVVESFGFNVKEVILEKKVVTLKDIDEHTHVFSLSDDIETQLARYFVVMSKVKGEEMKFESVDVRFERPVIKN